MLSMRLYYYLIPFSSSLIGIDKGRIKVVMHYAFRSIAQVSSEVVSPQAARPSEGLLFVNVELSPMAAPQFELGK